MAGARADSIRMCASLEDLLVLNPTELSFQMVGKPEVMAKVPINRVTAELILARGDFNETQVRPIS